MLRATVTRWDHAVGPKAKSHLVSRVDTSSLTLLTARSAICVSSGAYVVLLQVGTYFSAEDMGQSPSKLLIIDSPICCKLLLSVEMWKYAMRVSWRTSSPATRPPTGRQTILTRLVIMLASVWTWYSNEWNLPSVSGRMASAPFCFPVFPLIPPFPSHLSETLPMLAPVCPFWSKGWLVVCHRRT